MRFSVAAILALSCQLAHAAPPELPPAAIASPTDISPPGMTPAVEPTPAEDAGTKSYWYQTLGADGLAFAFTLAGARGNGDAGVTLGLGTYLLGAPIIHVAHGRPGRAVGSVAMRIGLPFLGAMVGAALEPKHNCRPGVDSFECGDDEGPSGEVVLGLLLGVVGASLIDATVMADGDAPAAKPQRTLAPTARASQHGIALGLSGTF